jgi:hypothetical protein
LKRRSPKRRGPPRALKGSFATTPRSDAPRTNRRVFCTYLMSNVKKSKRNASPARNFGQAEGIILICRYNISMESNKRQEAGQK